MLRSVPHDGQPGFHSPDGPLQVSDPSPLVDGPPQVSDSFPLGMALSRFQTPPPWGWTSPRFTLPPWGWPTPGFILLPLGMDHPGFHTPLFGDGPPQVSYSPLWGWPTPGFILPSLGMAHPGFQTSPLGDGPPRGLTLPTLGMAHPGFQTPPLGDGPPQGHLNLQALAAPPARAPGLVPRGRWQQRHRGSEAQVRRDPEEHRSVHGVSQW